MGGLPVRHAFADPVLERMTALMYARVPAP
jgi:hypothetical protein